MRRLLLAAALAAGCTQALRAPPQTPEATAWREARQRWTRSARLYDRLATHALVSACYQGPEVRERRADQVAAWRVMTVQEHARLLAAEAEAGAQWEEFLVSFFAAEPKDNDLDDRRSIWRVALVVPKEGELLPVEITQVRADAEVRELYPFIIEFAVVYRVRFPHLQGAPLTGRDFLLRIAGPEGRMDFDFGPGSKTKEEGTTGGTPEPATPGRPAR